MSASPAVGYWEGRPVARLSTVVYSLPHLCDRNAYIFTRMAAAHMATAAAAASFHAGSYSLSLPKYSRRSSYLSERPPRSERGALYLFLPMVRSLVLVTPPFHLSQCGPVTPGRPQ